MSWPQYTFYISTILIIIIILIFISRFFYHHESHPCQVVISHYHEDVHWVAQLPLVGFPDYLILSKTMEPVYLSINKGNEASIFLKYICDHYHQLKEYTVFLHGHEYAWHQDGSMLTLLPEKWNEMLQQKRLYMNLNNTPCGSILENQHIDLIRTWYKEFLEDEMGPIENHGDWTVGIPCCAQFIVHRSVIQRRSLKCYQGLLNWILTTELTNDISGRIMEWTWELLWEIKN